MAQSLSDQFLLSLQLSYSLQASLLSLSVATGSFNVLVVLAANEGANFEQEQRFQNQEITILFR